MRILSILFFCVVLLIGCESTDSQQKTNTIDQTGSSSTTSKEETEIPKPADKVVELPQKHDCKVQGIAMEDNELWIREAQTWVCIVADSITKDIDFGESFRILDVYNTNDCSLKTRHVLPVNQSPDFPYYLVNETYEPTNKVVCTQGYEYTYCYDVEGSDLLPKMEPKFLSERELEDAQSGMPQGLKILDRYLFGCSTDLGSYAFNLTDKRNPRPVLPVAEYAIPNSLSKFHSLYLLPQKDGSFSAIIPKMSEEDGFVVKPLFEQTLKINPEISKQARNNQYVVFNLKDTTPEQRIAIDMKVGAQVALPESIRTQKTSAILDWLKKR